MATFLFFQFSPRFSASQGEPMENYREACLSLLSGKLESTSGKLDFARQSQRAMRAAQRIKDLEGRVWTQQGTETQAARVSTGIRNHLVMITFMPAVTGMP